VSLPIPAFRPHLRAVASAAPLIPFRAAAGGMPIALGLFLAHRWGRRELAAFTIAHAAVIIAVAITDWGATRALPRNLATLAADAAAELLAAGNALRLGLVGAAAIVAAALIIAGAIDADAARYLTILFPLSPLFIVTTNAISERVVAGETRAITTAVAAGLLTFAVLGGIVLALNFGAPWLVAAYVAGKVIEASLLASGRWWVLSFSTTGVAGTAAALWPFAAQMILGVIYSRLAVFTVERVTTRAELGVFSVALAFQNAFLLIPTSLALTQFPELTRRWQDGDAGAVRRILVRYTIVSALGVLLGAVVLLSVAGRIAAALDVPPAMMPFVVAFAVLSFPSSLSLVAGFFMQARGEERLVSQLSVVTLSLALVYQVAALRAFGLWGIVAAVGAGEVTTIAVFALGLAYTRRDRDGR
jgi:O-antigen/teichoic acid export membrane protein